MSFLKPKSAYRPTRTETVLAWGFTAAAAGVVTWFVLRDLAVL